MKLKRFLIEYAEAAAQIAREEQRREEKMEKLNLNRKHMRKYH